METGMLGLEGEGLLWFYRNTGGERKCLEQLLCAVCVLSQEALDSPYDHCY